MAEISGKSHSLLKIPDSSEKSFPFTEDSWYDILGIYHLQKMADLDVRSLYSLLKIAKICEKLVLSIDDICNMLCERSHNCQQKIASIYMSEEITVY